ncbi:MAG: hypothetical protein PHQ23_01220 [Candidatus Wallbacteria bacterium]|nr:hypothetical protein [Candidatus Wallbacteria bacterium]
MKKVLVALVLFVAFSRIAAFESNPDITYLQRLIPALDKQGVSVSSGFVWYLTERLAEDSRAWNQEQNRFVENGISMIVNRCREIMDEFKTVGSVMERIDETINDFIDTANEVIAPSRRSFADTLAEAASNASSNCEKRTVNGEDVMFVYGMRTWYSGTAYTYMGMNFPGWNSCAYVVSAIFKGAGKSIGSIGSVSTLASKLAGMGYKTISSYSEVVKGDVIWWQGDDSRHIGVYTGWGRAVSNNSLTGKPGSHSAKSSQGGSPFYKAYRRQ